MVQLTSRRALTAGWHLCQTAAQDVQDIDADVCFCCTWNLGSLHDRHDHGEWQKRRHQPAIRLALGQSACLPGAKGLVLMQGGKLGEVHRLAQAKV